MVDTDAPPTPWLVHGPHEGLLIAHAGCASCVEALHETAIGRDLFSTPQPVEEFALQTLCAHGGHRFAQLSDMGGEGPEGTPEERRLPLTKAPRRAREEDAEPLL